MRKSYLRGYSIGPNEVYLFFMFDLIEYKGAITLDKISEHDSVH